MNNQLEFKQPFIGSQPELTAAEQREAADEFAELFSDLMLAGLAHARRETLLQGDEIIAERELVASNGDSLHVRIIDCEATSGGILPIQEIILVEKFVDNPLPRTTAYRLAADRSQVLRRDQSIDDWGPGLEVLEEGIPDRVHNAQLEQDMRLNSQPVDSGEVGRLRHLLIGGIE